MRRLKALERLAKGGRATYLGNGRLLMSAMVGDTIMPFLLEADDKLLTPGFVATGVYEVGSTRHLLKERRPHHHCIDAGANFGYFTCLMASRCRAGKVIGIEPDTAVRSLARDNVWINAVGEIAEVIEAAATDADGEVTLHRRDGRSGDTSIVECGGAGAEVPRAPPRAGELVLPGAAQPAPRRGPAADGRIGARRVRSAACRRPRPWRPRGRPRRAARPSRSA